MEDLQLQLYVSALATGFVFGYVIQRGGFCLTRAISNVVLTGDAAILRAYVLALLVAMVGVQILLATGVVEIPIRRGDAVLRPEPLMQRSTGIGREDVECRRLDAVLDRPFHRPLEHGRIVAIHAEDEAAVDHHADIVQSPDGGAVVASKVLELPLLEQVVGGQ